MSPVSRRDFVRVVAAVGGGVALGVVLPGCGRTEDGDPVEAWFRFEGGTTVLTIPTTDMGQGTLTSLAMLLAEDLELDWATVQTELAPAHDRYRAGRRQKTAASNSIRSRYDQFRRLGAGLRDLLVAEAAERWQVPVATCTAREGRVYHQASNRSVAYHELAPSLADRRLPLEPRLKPASEFRLIGRSLPRLDTPAKARGAIRYAGDLRLPDMVCATLLRAPRFGDPAPAVDPDRLPQGIRAVPVDDALALVGSSTWAVLEAARRLAPAAPTGSVGGADPLEARLTAALDGPLTWMGDAGPLERGGGEWLVRDYLTPFQAHAQLEPLNCLIALTRTACEIWIGTQEQSETHRQLADLTGLRPHQVTVHTTYVGGSFGRHQEYDLLRPAVAIARETGRPVRLTLNRAEDIRHGFYRAMAAGRLAARLDAGGWPEAIEVRTACPSAFRRFYPEVLSRTGRDPTMLYGLEDPPYAVSRYRAGYADVELGVPVGWMRGVTEVANAFFLESFVDELARAGGQDPLAYRHRLTEKTPRHRAVLEAAADRAGYSGAGSPGRGWGVALWETGRSPVATIVEVEDRGGRLRPRRVTVAVDCGLAINPDGVRSQVEGGVLYALSGAMQEAILVRDGAVVQTGFEDYPVIRMADAPPVEVVIVEGGGPPTGVGEAGSVGVAPALANAWAALTGVRLRRLPLEPSAPASFHT